MIALAFYYLSAKASQLLISTWRYCDIGKETEPAEYAGKPLRAWYDDSFTLETAVSKSIDAIVHGLRPMTEARAFALKQKKAWLQMISKPEITASEPAVQIQ